MIILNQNVQLIDIIKRSFNYFYSPSFPPLILPVFHDQQLSFIDNTEYENDTIRATQNILSFLQEKQSTTDNEVRKKREIEKLLVLYLSL